MTTARAERAYALLLRAYPREFRAAYGREMTICFRDLLRDAGAPGVGFWLAIVSDVARTASPLRAAALRARWSSNARMEEGQMKPMGILAVLIGLFQAANAITELTHGGTDGWPSVVVALAVVVGLLLVAAGVALLRGSAAARAISQLAAASWLLLVVVARVVHPWMSIASMMLAVVFPLVLLTYVWLTRQRGVTV